MTRTIVLVRAAGSTLLAVTETELAAEIDWPAG